jgi:hypothetical protein
VHVLTEWQARDAITLGADGLVHLFAAATVSSDFTDLVAKHGTFIIPTLGVLSPNCGEPNGAAIVNDSLLRPFIRPLWRPMMERTFARPNGPSPCEGTLGLIRELASRNLPVLVGTDAPSPGQTYGASVHGELQRLVGAGLTPPQALTAATAAPARAFGLLDRGRISEGMRADLLLVEGDPTRDVTATRRIVAVWKRGIRLTRSKY